jgi:hypothetical protein
VEGERWKGRWRPGLGLGFGFAFRGRDKTRRDGDGGRKDGDGVDGKNGGQSLKGRRSD